MLSPFIVYQHLFFDDVSANSFKIFNYTVFHGFNGTQSLAWYFLSKVIPAMLLIIWLFTCSFSWRYVIIVPISIYVYSIFLELVKIFSRDDINVYSIATFSSLVCVITLLYLDKQLTEIRNQRLKSSLLKMFIVIGEYMSDLRFDFKK